MSTNPHIDTVLGRLKSKIRTYVWVEGIALVVCLLCLLFWLAYGLDVLYFTVRRLELPQWFRVGYLFAAIAAIGAAIVLLFVFRLVRSYRSKALALVLERRFPDLDDRLITAVEMSDQRSAPQSALSRAMLDRTVQRVSRDAESLDLGDVFSKAPIRRAVFFAVLLTLATGTFWALNAEAVERVRKGFLGLDEVYWDRDTLLVARVVTQPGDRLRDFRDAEGRPTDGRPGVHKHPKGSDLTLLIIVPNGKNHEGLDWVVPDVEGISVRYKLARGGSGTARVIAKEDPLLLEQLDAQAIFEFTKADVATDAEIWITGNDFTNRSPYVIQAVDPPQLDEIVLRCDFPDYVHTVAAERIKRVSGRAQELPDETRFLFDATANKEIVGARVEFGNAELVFEPLLDANGNLGDMQAKLTVRSEEGNLQDERIIPPEIAANFLRSDGMGLRLPFVVTRGLTKPARDRAAEEFQYDETRDGIEAGVNYGSPFVIASGTRLRVYLTDADGISTIEPTQLVIDAREDTRPEFENLGLVAIGPQITPRARIPFHGAIVDDHGVVKGHFEFRIVRDPKNETPPAEPAEPGDPADDQPMAPDGFDLGPQWRVRPFAIPPTDDPTRFELDDGDPILALSAGSQDAIETDTTGTTVERFDVLPLDMKVGNKLVLVLYARDGDDLNGPHENRTAQYEFEIVSDSDLQASLYPKEMDLLEQLEQVIKEVTETRTDLENALGDAATRDRLLEAADRDEQVFAEAVKSLDGIARFAVTRVRTSKGECQAIENAFIEIREELLNNGFPERHVAHMQTAILDPLHRGNADHFPALDRSTGAFRVGIEEETPVDRLVQDGITHAESLLIELEKVRAELKDRVGYLKAVAELKAIFEQEVELQEKTRQEQIKNSIGDLEDLKGLQD